MEEPVEAEPLSLAQSVAWEAAELAEPQSPPEPPFESAAPPRIAEPPPLPQAAVEPSFFAPIEVHEEPDAAPPLVAETEPDSFAPSKVHDEPATLVAEPEPDFFAPEDSGLPEDSDLPEDFAPAPRSASWADAVESAPPAPRVDAPKTAPGKLDWLKGLGRKIGLSKSSAPETAPEPEPELETWTLEPRQEPQTQAPEPAATIAETDGLPPTAAEEPIAEALSFASAVELNKSPEAPAAPAFDWLKRAEPAAEALPEPPPILDVERAKVDEPEAEAAPLASPQPEAPAVDWLKMADQAARQDSKAEPEAPLASSMVESEEAPADEMSDLPAAEAPAPPAFDWLKQTEPAEAVPESEPEQPAQPGASLALVPVDDEFEAPETAQEDALEETSAPPKFDWSKVVSAADAPEAAESLLPALEETEFVGALEAPMLASPFSRSEPEPEPTHVAAMNWEEPEPPAPPQLHLAEPEPAAPMAEEPAVPEIFESAEAPSLSTDQIGMAKSYRWKRLGDLLVDLAVITPEQLAEALQLQKVAKKPLGQTLVENGYITESLLLKTLAAQYDVELWELETVEPSPSVARMLPEALCRERTMIAVARREEGIVVAMKNPADLEGLEEVQRITGMDAIPALASAERIESCISEIFNPIAQMKAMQEKSGIEVTNDQEFDVRVEPDGSVVQMVDELMEMAIKMKVSDVHIEPREKMVEVRVRLDGQLIKIKEYSKAIAPMLTARFKIMAEVDLVEWRIPQDGRISIKCDGRVVDMRVSILPSLYGQRIVMRLLDKSNALRKLDDLGFSQHNLVLFRKLINRPYGLFLVTGPTGSGKTTTLYAALNEIRKPTNNVMTCEDPVEYDIHGINQSQVNEKVGLTFGSQLRAILRQDPDIVLVGEIRDRETAEIAIKASMTGHMVLSTLHTNDAPGALPRLLDMGVDASNLSTALVGAMGQRLIRRLCSHCREDSAPTPDEIELLENSFGSTDLATLWRPVGCPKCHGQGYKGRMAIHEIMPVTSESAELVQQRAPIERIREVVRYYGYRTMQEDSLDRIVSGVTSLDEAKRILSFDDVPRLENPEAYYKKLQKSA